MPDPLFISDLITQVYNGQIRIPSFQRGFVWDPDRVAHLMDSLYKGYPFGSLLFWQTSTPLKTERSLGPFPLPPPKANYPIEYILDGQQRATSIFGVFQDRLTAEAGGDAEWTKIYFDLGTRPSAQDTQFIYLADDEVDPERHFPLRYLLDPPKWRKFVGSLSEDLASQIDELFKRFNKVVIPVQSFTTDDRPAVAIVFERINRLGVKLDTLQLLSAWTWSEDFDLQGQFEDIADEISQFGFKEVGEDSDLLLRCCAAVIAGDASPATIIDLKGDVVRARFAEIKTGIRGAIDFLRTHLNVYSTNVLPFSTLLIPLSVFFATDRDQSTHPNATQQARLIRWIWRTFFTRRYSKRLEQLNQDIKEIIKLKDKDTSCSLGEFPASITASFFTDNTFSLRNVDTKTFILILASAMPLDFIGGGKVAMDAVLRECNKKEFHHLFPRAYLKSINVPEDDIDALCNFCMIPRATNNKIGELKPSFYRTLMPKNPDQVVEILNAAICPASLFEDNFDQFRNERVMLLVNHAKKLAGI